MRRSTVLLEAPRQSCLLSRTFPQDPLAPLPLSLRRGSMHARFARGFLTLSPIETARTRNGETLAISLPRHLRGDPRSCTLSMRVRRGCSSGCTLIHERGAGTAIISSACLDAGTRLRLWRDDSSCGRAVHVRSWQRRCARTGIASATTACVATCATARLEGTRLRLWRDSSSCGRAVHVWSEQRRSGCTRAPGCARVRCERSAGLGCPSCSAQATHESAARLGRDRPGASHA